MACAVCRQRHVGSPRLSSEAAPALHSQETALVILDILSKMGMEALILLSHIQGHASGSGSDSSGSGS